MACRFYEVVVRARIPGGIRLHRDLHRIFLAAGALLADTGRHPYLCQSSGRGSAGVVACWRARKHETGTVHERDSGCNSLDSARGKSESRGAAMLGASARQFRCMKRTELNHHGHEGVRRKNPQALALVAARSSRFCFAQPCLIAWRARPSASASAGTSCVRQEAAAT
jgi:hypothetical protein